MKKVFLPAILLVSISPTLQWAQSPNFDASRFQPGPSPRNGIIAVVEEDVITEEEVRKIMAPSMGGIIRRSKTKQELNEQSNQLANDIIQKLIDDILIVHNFREKGYQIPKSVIENQYNNAIKREFGNDRSRFLRYLREENMTVRQYREDLEKKIIVQSTISRMRKTQAEISPEKIEEYYRKNKLFFFQDESVHLSQITLAPYAEVGPEQLMKTAERILERLGKGEDFGKLARIHSKDDRRKDGGDFGWLKKSELRKELADIAFTLKPGQHSKSFRMGDHVFILKVNDKRGEGIQALDEVRDRIEGLLNDQVAREAQRSWLLRLRKKAHIRYY